MPEQNVFTVPSVADLTAKPWLRDLTKKSCENYYNFFRNAWFQLPSAGDFVPAGHVKVVCDHLQAAFEKKIDRLLINIPPECLKSTLVSLLWPCYIWSRRPQAGILFVTYEGGPKTRDATLARAVMESDWYQILWPHIQLRSDQNAKDDYRNTLGGWRISTSMEGRITAEHPEYFIWDDPLKAIEASSKAARDKCKNFYRTAMSTRGRAKGVVHVIAQQRLHPEDPSSIAYDANKAAVMEREPEPWVIVRFPMRYDPELAMKDYGYGVDWRKTKGELLDPVRMPEKKVAAGERELGQVAAAAQFQQNPIHATGRFFDVERLKYIKKSELPKLDFIVRFWDKAATEGGGCDTAGVKIGLTKKTFANGEEEFRYFIMHCRSGQWGPAEVESQIVVQSRIDGVAHGMSVYKVGMEEEGGSGGKISSWYTSKQLREFQFEAIRAEKNKAGRAQPLARAMEREEVYIVIDDTAPNSKKADLETLEPNKWIPSFVEQMREFSADGNGKKDKIDAASGAFAMVGGAIGKPRNNGTVLATSIESKYRPCASPDCKEFAAPESDYCCDHCEGSMLEGIACTDHDIHCQKRSFDYSQEFGS